MPELISPHGGLDAPRTRTIPESESEETLARAANLPTVEVSDADLSTVQRLGDGALSPLDGPMDAETYHRMLEESVIEHNGSPYAWTIPISLPVDEETANVIGSGAQVSLVHGRGEIVAILDVTDVFRWDKPHYLERVYLTSRTDYSGADMVLEGDAGKTHLVGGTDPGLPSAFERQFQPISQVSSRGAIASGRQRMGPCRCFPDPESAPPCPRIRSGLWPRTSPASGS